ncbi:MAG: hypothetical protein JSS10_04690 [Verrucomicrobia bacterium]|nr:hypothetical protein [Verrucomicrobiota bacterium]
MAFRVRPAATATSRSHVTRLPTSSASLHASRRFSTKTKTGCECKLDPEKIRECLIQGKKEDFRGLMEGCKVKQGYTRSWEPYQVEQRTNLSQPSCKAFEVVRSALPVALPGQVHIKEINAETSVLFEANLYILSSEPGEITLAGEGGHHVGRQEYWNPIIDRLAAHKHLPVRILSIGGGIGFDVQAISEVFRKADFRIQQMTVVDPNQLAAFLAKEVEYYVMTSQSFFDRHFVRQEDNIYLFHLGTTLNVVLENQAVHILRQIAENMKSKDILSLIMVDKKQFEKGRALTFGPETEEGFSKVINKKTGKHYKTVIANPIKFINFMSKLGLAGELVEITEKNVPLEVAFVAYKTLKNSDNNK